eukprot:TRINITY_DN2475_c0_g1_i1.p1 TRINITY_DN2475_c0_g1~~TRINITY_DN2475_c0_g1_i1.p1  ORF type:complete len:399 (-),score=100.18 TRINITY_DN2475_c0_g1_i1:234-1430(-)
MVEMLFVSKNFRKLKDMMVLLIFMLSIVSGIKCDECVVTNENGCLNDIPYNVESQFVCGNLIFDKDTHSCCDGVGYDISEYSCCNGVIIFNFSGSLVCTMYDLDQIPINNEIVDRERYLIQKKEKSISEQHTESDDTPNDDNCVPTHETGCINNKPYDIDTQYVCGNGVIVNNSTQGCCGEVVYEKATERCCNMTIVEKSTNETCFSKCIPSMDYGCLNNNIFDTNLQSICGYQIVEDILDSDPCCNGNTYDTEIQTCCGRSYPKPLDRGSCKASFRDKVDKHFERYNLYGEPDEDILVYGSSSMIESISSVNLINRKDSPCSSSSALDCVFPVLDTNERTFCFNNKLFSSEYCHVCKEKVLETAVEGCCNNIPYNLYYSSCCDGKLIPSANSCSFEL